MLHGGEATLLRQSHEAMEATEVLCFFPFGVEQLQMQQAA